MPCNFALLARASTRAHHSAAVLLLLAMPSSAFGQSFGPDAPDRTSPVLNVSFRTTSQATETSRGLTLPLPTPEVMRMLQAHARGPCGDQALIDAAPKRAADAWPGMSMRSRQIWGEVGDFLTSLLGDHLERYEPSQSPVNRQFVTDLANGTTLGGGLPAWVPPCPPPKPPARIKRHKMP